MNLMFKAQWIGKSESISFDFISFCCDWCCRKKRESGSASFKCCWTDRAIIDDTEMHFALHPPTKSSLIAFIVNNKIWFLSCCIAWKESGRKHEMWDFHVHSTQKKLRISDGFWWYGDHSLSVAFRKSFSFQAGFSELFLVSCPTPRCDENKSTGTDTKVMQSEFFSVIKSLTTL